MSLFRLPERQKMEFTTNSVRNTTLATPDDSFYYEIVTRFWHPKVTKINVLDPDTKIIKTVAEIERVGNRSQNRVRFLEGEELGPWIPGDEFLKYSPDDMAGGVFRAQNGQLYRWKTHRRRLQLVRADNEREPLVLYHHFKRYFMVLRMSQHAWLEVTPEAMSILDRLIVSYILVERKRRMKLRVPLI